MGCGHSRRQSRPEVRRGTMERRSGSQTTAESTVDREERSDRSSLRSSDFTTLLSYIMRSGGRIQVASASQPLNHLDDSDEYIDYREDEDEEECIFPRERPKEDKCPDTSVIDESEFKTEVLRATGQISDPRCNSKTSVPSIPQLLYEREHGLLKSGFSGSDKRIINSNYLPNKKETMVKLHSKAFCGTYSQSGDIFLSACQDRYIRIYDTSNGNFKQFRAIMAMDVGWSVLDTAFSPDGNFLVYSSWSNYLHLCSIYGDYQTHSALFLNPETQHSFCIFSTAFSQDNKEIMGGSNDRCIYVFDRELNTRTLRIVAHEDDVNAVAFADETSQILFSGSDDGLCKIWDRRTLRESDPKPIGILAGHHDGITFIDSKLDGRYLISNCKDQSIKLWDIRRLSSKEVQDATRRAVARQNWDYRWQQVPRKIMVQKNRIEGDSSLMTYRGHCVLNTLVRCRFSPSYSTGQRYIYTGCASGVIIVYDVLTGKVVTKLDGHKQCVRDVSWHPYENIIMSSSWDCSVSRWSYAYQPEEEDEEMEGKDGSRGGNKRGDRRGANKSRSQRSRPYQLRSTSVFHSSSHADLSD